MRSLRLAARPLACLAIILVMAGSALAFQAATQPPAGQPAQPPSTLALIIKGAMAGGVAAAIGCASQKKMPDGSHEGWSWGQFAFTVIIGILVGVAASFLKTDLATLIDKTEASPLWPIVVLGFQYLPKALGRNIFPGLSLADVGTWIKAGASKGNPTTPGGSPPATGTP